MPQTRQKLTAAVSRLLEPACARAATPKLSLTPVLTQYVDPICWPPVHAGPCWCACWCPGERRAAGRVHEQHWWRLGQCQEGACSRGVLVNYPEAQGTWLALTLLTFGMSAICGP
eukprot:scaffold50872_cov18-Tisochrysis_lutea.AAC.6